MIGLRFSTCIMDLAKGYVRLADVEIIYTATACKTPMAWLMLIDVCHGKYWGEYGNKCARLALELIEAGIIQQPKLLTGQYPVVVMNCHWLLPTREIEWKKCGI